jgi:hypothetical protein
MRPMEARKVVPPPSSAARKISFAMVVRCLDCNNNQKSENTSLELFYGMAHTTGLNT